MPKLGLKSWKHELDQILQQEKIYSKYYLNCYLDTQKTTSRVACSYAYSSYDLTNVIDIDSVQNLYEGTGFIYGKNVVHKILNYYAHEKGNYIYMDNSYFSRFYRDGVDRYRLVVNHIHPQAYTETTELKSYQRYLEPWKERKNDYLHILICPPTGTVLNLFGIKEDWLNKTISKIRNRTNRKILIRFKNDYYFNSKKEEELNALNKKYGNIIFDKEITLAKLEDLFRDCYAVVAPASGVAVLAAVYGIPVFSEKIGPVANISQEYSLINEPIYPERQQWLNLLLNHEFKLEDIYSGEWLIRLKQIYPKELKRMSDAKINLF